MKEEIKYKSMLFSFGKSNFLGIDFGTASIKAVELTLRDKKPTLVNYGEISLKAVRQKTAEGLSYDQAVGLHVQALLERMQPKTKVAAVAIPAFSGLITLIEMPELEQKEMEQAVRFEAHKYVPSALEDVALSWETVGYQEKKENTPAAMEVLLVAALKKDVVRYQQYLSGTGYNATFLELETFSLVRAIIGQKKGTLLLIDIGARATNLVLVQEGMVKVSRNIDAGGNNITRTLMEAMGVVEEKAEEIKKGGRDLLNDPQSALLFPALQAIASEAERILSVQKSKHPETQIDGIILSGGSSRFSGLTKYWENIFHIPVTIGNPWSAIASKNNVAKEIDSSYSVALGLALSGIEARSPKEKIGKRAPTLKELLNKKI